MGKIRVKSFGDQEQEEKDKRLSSKRAEKKALKKAAGVSSHDVNATDESTKSEDTSKVPTEQTSQDIKSAEENTLSKSGASGSPKTQTKKAKFKKDKKAFRSKKYDDLSATIDKTKFYALNEALSLLEKLQRGKFDETVEIHINTVSAGVSGNAVLPNGTGKATRVAVADDKIIADVEKGIINFDVLVSTPDIMPKLAKVARVLGPRGLMPNPKNGTITNNPQEVVKKYEGGQINFKTEAKAPIIHMSVGKVSFGLKKLEENIETLINEIKKSNISNLTLKSTMSPGIKVKI